MGLFKVVLQKSVPGKGQPSEALRRKHQRVVVVEAEDRVGAALRVLEPGGDAQNLAVSGTTGEIVSVERVHSWFVVLAP